MRSGRIPPGAGEPRGPQNGLPEPGERIPGKGADPEHHDQWIDEAIKWLERAMEASCHVSVTVEAGDGRTGPEAP
ncbi:hypothetical protein QA640_25575 [Bradyrhizobium sp. CB82]|uniref:hypothetical protein n=1 Tax=Bradyrhizobium sp. CB82 TaxID=3039159 RepID=UPI0024B1F088|nr:hypothetical protein [Bradyrhizobium sp. CB82]WFU37825.1 hypothetical protein QA640_25575 [Bradyrhizobium sp. CB82]